MKWWGILYVLNFKGDVNIASFIENEKISKVDKENKKCFFEEDSNEDDDY